MQNKITEPSRLLDKHEQLIQKGYATSLILDYRREDVKTRWLRLKEWDYYLIYNDNYGVDLIVGYSAFVGIISVSFIDFTNVEERAKNVIIAFPIGKINMPESSEIGDIIYHDKRIKISFKHEEDVRNLYMEMKNFEGGYDLKVSIILSNEPKDSMVIATPFTEDRKAFYYNQKIIGMRASGNVCYKDKIYEFTPDNSLALLDWGRGVWPYKTKWYWSAGQGMVNGKIFGFNLGYGFGDTSAATENMLFYDGIAHKLENVIFKISKNEDNEFDYMKPWIFTSSDQRFEMNFTPIMDCSSYFSAILVSTDTHQVFGKFTGRAVLDDGTVIELRDFLGFAERAKNKW